MTHNNITKKFLALYFKVIAMMTDQSFIPTREFHFSASNHVKQKQMPIKRLSHQLSEKNHVCFYVSVQSII